MSSLAFHSRGDQSKRLPAVVGALPGLTALWTKSKGDPAICIAILDAPVDRANPCLQPAKIEEHWLGHHPHCAAHGTEVASVIFASHDSPVWGMAPGCRGVSIPIYDCDPGARRRPIKGSLPARFTRPWRQGLTSLMRAPGNWFPIRLQKPIWLTPCVRASEPAC